MSRVKMVNVSSDWLAAVAKQFPLLEGSNVMSQGTKTEAEWIAQFKAEYAQDREYFQRSGTTEEQYIASRRVSAGLDVLRVSTEL